MNCPHCNSRNSRVISVRTNAAETATIRRRECLDCHERFSTVETVEVVRRGPAPRIAPVATAEPALPADVAPVTRPAATRPPTPKLNNTDKRRQLNDFMARYRDAQRTAKGGL